MKRLLWLVLLLPFGLPAPQAWSSSFKKDSSALLRTNNRIRGTLVDYTANHGCDNRLWSRSLAQKRDVYVYLPPCYDKNLSYPFMILMHGFAYDEQSLLEIIPDLDKAICDKRLPPMIIAIPDGSIKGEPSLNQPGSFFINSDAGNFEDFILHDVWDLVCKRYSIRSEREAHILGGISMGGFAAYNLGMRYRQTFGVVAAIHPPLNLRWQSIEGLYFEDFDPRFWGWRTKMDHRREVIARFGLAKVRLCDVVEPLFGIGDDALRRLSLENPVELVDRTHLRDGQLAMYVGYGAKDEYNIDAQVESFLYLCKFRGITVHVGYDCDGRHDAATAHRLLPGLFEFLNRAVGPYAPDACGACREPVCLPCATGECDTGACVAPVRYLRHGEK